MATNLPLPDNIQVLNEPRVEELDDGGVEVTFSEEVQEPQNDIPRNHYENLALFLDESTLSGIGFKVVDGYTSDLSSREDWSDQLAKGIDLLGLTLDDRALPFQGACNATHPLLIENCVKFQSKAIQQIFPPDGPVRTKINGAWTPELEDKAGRIKNHMNFQLTEEMPEYFDDTEALLFYLSYAGVAFRKWYYDPVERRPVAYFLRADDFVVSNSARDLKRAPRYTEILYKDEVSYKRDLAVQMYRDVELGQPPLPEENRVKEKMNEKLGVGQNAMNPVPVYTFLEQHLYLDEPGLADTNGTPLPYVVTVDLHSQKVLSIYRLWSQDDPAKKRRVHYIKYTFVPSENFYSFGYVHLIGALTKTATFAMRSLVDAGQFANMQGGFKLKGMKVVGGNTPHSPGEFKDVEVPGLQDISKAIMPFTYKEPSQTLYQLLQFIVGEAQQFADSTESVVADSTNYGPVGTTLALLEQSTKFFSSIHKRLHKSLRDEFRLQKALNREFIIEEQKFHHDGAATFIRPGDYDDTIDVIPVSDPNIASQAQRAAIAQAVLQMAGQAPDLHDKRAAFYYVYKTLGVENIDTLLPAPKPPQPQDPLTDLQSVSKGQAIQSFQGQDHDSHIAVKSAWLQDPLQGANPIMAQVAPLVMSNVRDHLLMKFQEQIMQVIQQSGANPQQIPPEKLFALAAQEVLKQDQQKAQGGPVDPEQAMIQLQAQELGLKNKELEHKINYDFAQLSIRDRDIGAREQKNELDALEKGIKLAQDEKHKRMEIASDFTLEAIKGLAQENVARVNLEGRQKMKKESK